MHRFKKLSRLFLLFYADLTFNAILSRFISQNERNKTVFTLNPYIGTTQSQHAPHYRLYGAGEIRFDTVLTREFSWDGIKLTGSPE